MSSDLPRLPQKRRRPSSDANAATYAALMGLVFLVFGLMGIIALVLPQVGGLILVLIGGLGFFAIHYLIWGRLLTKLREREADAPETRTE